MRANVYALFEVRSDALDHYMVTATVQEAIEYYRTKTGKPGVITTEGTDDAGHEVYRLDEDANGGAAYVAQYNVGLVEITEE